MIDAMQRLSDNIPRSHRWDILKFLLIFLVVVGHMADYYTQSSEEMRALYFFIYSFHMPVFFFISGLFSKRSINEKRTEKVIGYLILFVFMKILIYLIKVISGFETQFRIFHGDGFDWYLLVIAMSMALTMLIKDFSPGYVMIISILFSCFSGYDTDLGTFLSLSRFFVFYPFFFLGYSIDRNKAEVFVNKKYLKIISILVLSAFAVVVFCNCEEIYRFRPLLTGMHSYATLGELSEYGFWFRLLYYIISSLLGFAVISLVPCKTPSGIAAKLGQRTLSVYVFHYPVLVLLFSILDCKAVFANLIPWISEWIIIPVSLVITVFLSFKPLNGILLKIMNVPMKNLKK